MNRPNIFGLSALAVLGSTLLSGSAVSQRIASTKELLTGTWTVVSVDNTAPDGKKSQVFGPNPKGILVFDPSGQYAQIIVRPDVPKFKDSNRLKGTPEENAAAVHGTTATFGTWTLDEAGNTITIRNVGGMFPNQAGTETKRTIVSVGSDELRLTNPLTATGVRSDNVWKRAK